MMGKPRPWWPGIRQGHPLARGLVGLWPFWEGAGSRAGELVHNRAASLTMGWGASSIGVGLTNNDTSGKCGTVTGFPEIINQDMSVAAWLVTDTQQTAGIVGNKFDTTGWWFVTWTGGKLGLFAHGSGIGDLATANTALTVGAVSHGVAVWAHANTTATFYLNGQPDGSEATADSPAGGTTTLYIGEDGRDGTGYPWNGELLSVIVWSRALLSTEANELYEDPWGLITPRKKTYIYYQAPAAGQPMMLRGTTVPHMRQWHVRRAG